MSFTIVYGVLTDVILSQEIGSATAFDLIFCRSDKRRIEPVLIKKAAEFFIILAPAVLKIVRHQRLFLIRTLCELIGLTFLRPLQTPPSCLRFSLRRSSCPDSPLFR